MTKDYSNCVFLDKYPGYAICPEGRVFKVKSGREVSTTIGYVTEEGKAARRRIKHLIAEAFVPNPTGVSAVFYLDGDETNNHPSNLSWGFKGSSQLTAKQINAIHDLASEGWKQEDIASKFGVHRITVARIVTGRCWKEIYLQRNGGVEPKRKLFLTEDQVKVIYTRLLDGELSRDIAKDFNVVSSAISNIKTGRSYKHLYHLYTEGLEEQEENRNV